MNEGTAPPREAGLTGLYEGLARYQWWSRCFSRARPGEGLEMHKRLSPPAGDGPAAGSAGLNEWLWERLTPECDVRVLDVGCGFGATLTCWARRATAGHFVGLSLSPLQVKIARREAEKVGVGDRCEFRVQSYDDPLEGSFDVVVSVESLFHSRDVVRTVRHLAEHLAPGGTFLLVEDMARTADATRDGAARELLTRWSTARLHTADDFRRAFEEAGLGLVEDVDLTPQVPFRTPTEVDASHARLVRLRRLCPWSGGRRILDAFLGGLALERLYEQERMEYRVLRAHAEASRP